MLDHAGAGRPTKGGVVGLTAGGRSVAEDVYGLVYDRVPESVLAATLVGAVLGELRLLGRVRLDEHALVRVHDPTPIGHPVLDLMLARVAAEKGWPPYMWVAVAGEEVRERVADRVWRSRPRYLDPEQAAELEVFRAELVADMLDGVAAWLRDPWRDSRSALLGRLLWGAEQSGYLSRLSAVERRELSRAATADDFAVFRGKANYVPYRPRIVEHQRRRVPAARPVGPWWVAPLLTAVAAVLVVAAVVFGLASGDGHGNLRDSGVAAKAMVADVRVEQRTNRGSRTTYETNILLLEYQSPDASYREDVMCMKDCAAVGEIVGIWYDPADPAVFVTEWGVSSRPDTGDARVWVCGVIGGMLLLAAFVVRHARRTRQ
jgi:hypothetical protein